MSPGKKDLSNKDRERTLKEAEKDVGTELRPYKKNIEKQEQEEEEKEN